MPVPKPVRQFVRSVVGEFCPERVILFGMRDKIHEVFKIAHLDKILTFAEDEGKAFKLLGVHV